MKKVYLILTVTVIIAAAILSIVNIFSQQNSYYPEHQHSERFTDVYLDDEEYLIYPSDSLEGKWCIAFPNDELYVDLKPEQIALFLKSGEIPADTTWEIYPQCEYQLTMEDTTIIVESFGRPVCELPYSQTGKLGKALIKDNE